GGRNGHRPRAQRYPARLRPAFLRAGDARGTGALGSTIARHRHPAARQRGAAQEGLGMNADQAIAETTARAKQLLFDKNGELKGLDYFLAAFTLTTVLRRASASECVKPGLGQSLINWDGTLFVYDAGIAEIFFHDARDGDHHADRVLCNAAALILGKTG